MIRLNTDKICPHFVFTLHDPVVVIRFTNECSQHRNCVLHQTCISSQRGRCCAGPVDKHKITPAIRVAHDLIAGEKNIIAVNSLLIDWPSRPFK